ncbi:MAG: hypoxanthine phosphoribosyltransferase [Hyphomicrobiaceae bacterium]|nr:hypoxanthine phosphoribosyltransferase [Hyphomicrobiaceae bacterium]
MARDLAKDPPNLVVGILTGAVFFASDLMRALYLEGVQPDLDFVRLSSYGAGTVTTGSADMTAPPFLPIEGRDVLLVDDILDTGITMREAHKLYSERGAKRVRIAVLLDKPARRAAPVKPDFVGFDCPDRFVAGYGIDKGHAHRGAPFVGVPE